MRHACGCTPKCPCDVAVELLVTGSYRELAEHLEAWTLDLPGDNAAELERDAAPHPSHAGRS